MHTENYPDHKREDRPGIHLLCHVGHNSINLRKEHRMKYQQELTLKNGKTALLRNGVESDGAAIFETFQQTHAETDYLLSYPDENRSDPQQEGQFLAARTASENEIEILALVDGKVAGNAGIEAVGSSCKVRHRAVFGISLRKEYWGLGLGKALTEACIQCAKEAGYAQLELEVVAENTRAIALYRKEGFVEYGRNPAGFRSRISGDQELVSMLRKL